MKKLNTTSAHKDHKCFGVNFAISHLVDCGCSKTMKIYIRTKNLIHAISAVHFRLQNIFMKNSQIFENSGLIVYLHFQSLFSLYLSHEFAETHQKCSPCSWKGSGNQRDPGETDYSELKAIHLRIMWQSYEISICLELSHAETYWSEKL